MKVVYVLPISWGGIPHYTAELANAISKYVDVIVIKPNDQNDELFTENVEIINAFKPMYFSVKYKIKAFTPRNLINFFSFKNIKIIDSIRPDILHFPGGIYPQVAVFSLLHNIHRKYPIVNTVHGIFSPSAIFRVKSLTFVILAGLADRISYLVKSDIIIVHTREDKDKLVRRGINPRNIVIIPHGTYTFFKKYCKKDKVPNDKNYILFFGYIRENKGIEYLIKATPIICKEIPDAKVIIAGEGDITKYIEFIKDKSKFEIYNEYIPNKKVSELFQRAKVVVLPYTHKGGHSGVLTIAYAFGKPVVVTNVGDFPKLAERVGLVVPAKNSKALAEAIIRILKDDKLQRKMSRNALKKAEKLSWNNIAKRHIEVYEKLLERGVNK